MKASELIERLQYLIADHGDQEVKHGANSNQDVDDVVFYKGDTWGSGSDSSFDIKSFE